MGSCLSRTSPHLSTAKLVVIEEDSGASITEFPRHVKVAEILRERPGFFVCHADSMRYDEYASPLSAEQELQMEHLYFLLPVTKLRHPLTASDMAALAVKASAAMERSRRCCNKLGRRPCKIMPSLITMEQDVNSDDEITLSSSSGKREVGLRPGPVHYKLQRVASRRKSVNGVTLKSKLSTIHEEAFV